jgi:hypothetical protein
MRLVALMPMVEKKRTGRTFSSLSLEGGVIVISIMLAFVLDALWDSSKREREAQLALVSLEDEFAANLEACVFVLDHHLKQAGHLNQVLSMSLESIEAMGDEEATSAYYAFCSPKSFDALLGTTNSVISTGTFSILQDAALRRELDIFLNLMDDTREDIQNMLHFMRVLGEYEVALGGPWGRPSPPTPTKPDMSYCKMVSGEQLAALLRDQGYVGRVKLYHGCAGYYCSELNRIASQTRKLLKMIAALRS